MHFVFTVVMSHSLPTMCTQLMHSAIPCSVCMHYRVRECMSDTRMFGYVFVFCYVCLDLHNDTFLLLCGVNTVMRNTH